MCILRQSLTSFYGSKGLIRRFFTLLLLLAFGGSIANAATIYIGTTDSPWPPASFTPFTTPNPQPSSGAQPYNGTLQADFDAIVDYFIQTDLNLTIQLLEGNFVTDGIEPYWNQGVTFKILGRGKQYTTLKLKNNAPISNWNPNDDGYGPIKYVIHFLGRWTDNFEVKDLTVNCNFWGQSQYSYSGWTKGFKLGGIVAACTTGTVERVAVMNYGANKDTFGQTNGDGTEVFPLSLESDVVIANPILSIRYCDVYSGNFVNGGYATAIRIINGYGRAAVPTQCLVEGCNVWSSWNAIAYGTGVSEGITFNANYCSGVAAVFNDDVGPVRNITISNSGFDADFGINFSKKWPQAWETFDHLTIVDNQITVRGPLACGWSYSWGVRLGGQCSNVSIASGNIVNLLGSPSWKVVQLEGQSYGPGISSEHPIYWLPWNYDEVNCD